MNSSGERRLSAYEKQTAELQMQLKVDGRRDRQLATPPTGRAQARCVLEERLLDTKGQLAQALTQNEEADLHAARGATTCAALREEVDKLTKPPSSYGTFLGLNDDQTGDIYANGRKMRVESASGLDAEVLQRGAEVVLQRVAQHRGGPGAEPTPARLSPSKKYRATSLGRSSLAATKSG
ncbi:MAG: hypothetical protein R2706_09125 [Acidimicrobiales bacterium]